MFSTISNFFLNWVVFSALYALTAIGFTLIFGVGGVLNLAHGASITIGAFLTLTWYSSVAGWLPDTAALLVVCVAGLLVVAMFNLVLYLVFVRGLERVYETAEQVSLTVMVVTLIAALVVEETTRLQFGTQARSVPDFVGGTVPGTNVEMNLLVGFVVSWLVIGGLFLFLDRSRLGKALVAASMSRRGAEIVGVDIRRLYLLTWVIAGVLAGIAGVFLGSFQGASPTMGRSPLVISFAIVVLGGLGSVKGSVIAAYAIGLLEIGTTTFIDPSATGLTAFLVIVLVLLVRPSGLYGRELQVGQ